MEKHKKDCSSFKCVFLALLNQGYLPYFYNLLQNLKDLQIDNFPLIVACTDETSFLAVKSTETSAIHYKNPNSSPLSEKFEVYGSESYKKMMFSKLDIILEASESAKKNGIDYICYLDLDVAFLADPRQFLLTLIQSNPEVDVFTQCDETVASSCSSPKHCPNPCGGFMLFRILGICKTWFAYTPQDLLDKNDQEFIRDKWIESNVQRLSIMRELFPNGSFAQVSSKSSKEHLPNAIMIHFNYVTGNQKEAKMKEWGFWKV